MQNGMRIGIDLGGTKVEGIALDREGNELGRLRRPTPKGDYPGTVAAIAGVVRDLESKIAATASVGVGIPGTIMPATGLVKNANSTWLNGKPLESDLSQILQRAVRCENDANCFAISEATDGAGKGYGVVFGVIVGTGCGGGIVVHGKVLDGLNGNAGEWGHNPLPWPTGDEFPGPACFCGKYGCTERWISGSGFAADFERLTRKQWTAEQIVKAAGEGDVEADAAIARLEDRMARCLSTVINLLDPDVIVLGGGLSRVERLYKNVQPKLKEYVFGRDVSTPIVQAVHGDSSGVRGAAWLWSEAEQPA